MTVIANASSAQAATDTNYKYSTPRKGYFTIDAGGMTPESSSLIYSVSSAPVALSLAPASPIGCFRASVNLPQGAQITAVNAFYSTALTGNTPYFSLRRVDLNTGMPEIIAEKIVPLTTVGRKAYAAPVAVGLAAVNEIKYSYEFMMCTMSSNHAFGGARIMYTVGNAGD
jgi:hypothetical protein